MSSKAETKRSRLNRMLQFSWYDPFTRQCREKLLANALYQFGVKKLSLARSFCHGYPNDPAGLICSPNCIIAEPLVCISRRPLLWTALEQVGIGVTGTASSCFDSGGKFARRTGYMSASFLPKDSEWSKISLALVIEYFNAFVDIGSKREA